MNIIPIGSFCQLPATLERLNLRKEAYPFDYLRTNPMMITDCINNNFENFLNKDNYFLNNSYIGIKNYGNDIFIHHNIIKKDIYETFVRRIDRFTNLLHNNNYKIFISLFIAWDDKNSGLYDGRNINKTLKDIDDLYESIKNKTTNFKLIIIFNPVTGIQNTSIIEENEKYIIYKLETKECSQGYHYNEDDEKYFSNFILEIINNL